MDDLSFLTAGAPEAPDDPLAFMDPDPSLGASVFQMKPVESPAEPVWHDLGGSITPAAETECELPARVPDQSMVPTSAAEFKRAIGELEKKEVYAKAACSGAAMGLIYARTTGERAASLEYQRVARLAHGVAEKKLANLRLAHQKFLKGESGAGIDSDEARRIHYQKLYGLGD